MSYRVPPDPFAFTESAPVRASIGGNRGLVKILEAVSNLIGIRADSVLIFEDYRQYLEGKQRATPPISRGSNWIAVHIFQPESAGKVADESGI
jgi:hypothetical protein